MKFEYDENGAKFVYFALSFYAMIIIPVTYYFWPKKETKSERLYKDTQTVLFNFNNHIIVLFI